MAYPEDYTVFEFIEDCDEENNFITETELEEKLEEISINWEIIV